MARILLAEDKKDVGMLMEEILKHEGHDVTLTGNGEEAIQALQTGTSYDLLITDIIMPVMDGFDLVNFIRKEKIDLPIVAVSGGGVTLSSESALRAIENDVDMLLRKPVNIDSLNEVIAKLLG